MADIWKEAEERRGLTEPSPARVFLEFAYQEIKDLLKHFLTLISAALVFSVTFSEKIIDFATATDGQKVMVVAGWFSLIVALGLCGIGVFTLYLTSSHAIATVLRGQDTGFRKWQKASYVFQDAAGAFFGIGLVLLVATAIARLFPSAPLTPSAFCLQAGSQPSSAKS